MHEAISSELDEPYHLVGHDIGAWIVYPWASRFSTSIQSVTFIDGAVPGLAAPNQYPLPAALNIKLWQFSFNSLPELPEILTQGKERELLNWLFDYKAVQRHMITEKARDTYVTCYSRSGAMSRGFAYYRSVSTSAQQNKAMATESKIEVPVLAIGGSAAVGEGMKTAVQPIVGGNFATFVVDQCGHYVMEEQPERVAEILSRFFGEAEKRA